MDTATNTRRQRADGTWTFTTEAWDAKWYWPVGTRVIFRDMPGVVVKTNQVTVRVRFTDGRDVTMSVRLLTRLR